MTNTPAHTHLATHGMYHPDRESDACGVGLIAAIHGKPSRRVVEAGIEALRAVWHRGAVDADGKTGDGAGILVDLPERFFDEAIADSGHKMQPNRLAVGMVFLPRTDLNAQEICRTIVESEIIEFGFEIYGWRQVPVDISVIGQKAQATRPEIEQIMIAGPMPDDVDAAEFEKNLFLIRKRIEKRIIEAQVRDFYICSLSGRSIVYKGLFLAESLATFTPILPTNASKAASRSSTSAIRPTPSRNGGWLSHSARSPIMARSTQSAATRTGCRATRSRWRASRSAIIRRKSNR